MPSAVTIKRLKKVVGGKSILKSIDLAVYVIQAALPCITQIAVLAKYHHADVEYATTCVASTTLLAAITLPIWMMILTAIY